MSESTQELTLNITPGTGMAVNQNSTSSGSVSRILNPQIQLEFPEAGTLFSRMNRGWIYLALCLMGTLVIFFQSALQLKGASSEPELVRIISEKMKLIEQSVSKGDHRKVGSEATNLIYLLVAQLAGQKRADQELHLLVNEISAKDRQVYIPRITEIFDYFQLIGFSPDEIMNETLKRRPIAAQCDGLKKLTSEILVKLKKENG